VTPRLATFWVFVINGAMIGTWIAHLPWLQDHLGISKATLGFCLLCAALGAFISMPVTGQLLDRYSSASLTRVSTLVFCLMLPLPLLATGPYMLGAILFVFGASNGAMDVSMNAHGVAVERMSPKPIMSSLHAGYSLGGFAAAGLVAIVAVAGVGPRVESLFVGVALWLGGFWVTRRLGSASSHSEASSGLALPSRAVLLLGVLCFVAMMTEGAIADWSGIYLRHNTGAGAATAALAFTGFSLGMLVGRLGGDALNERLGAGTLLRGGSALLALALGATLLVGATGPAIVGFTLCGLGVANAVPLLFSAAGRHEPPNPSLAATFTVGYMGFIVGPPVIGLLSDQFGLAKTLALLPVLALGLFVFGGRALATPAGNRVPDGELPRAVEEIVA
jgi:predicted MFS family arabinose efflux permease